MEKPFVLGETEDFAVVCKPPRMHCAPLGQGGGNTLLDWYAAIFPAVMGLSGRKEGEGGLLHRLDYETSGLVLFAKNQASLDKLAALQNEGKFIKEYSAICIKNNTPLPSFPPPPEFSGQKSFVVESCFRPFGPGRKQVRPVMHGPGACYRTEIVNVEKTEPGDCYAFALRLTRGFRHQIRCHLAWIGCPILHDPIYGGFHGEQPSDSFLALRANGLVFADPRSGELREYRISPLEIQPNSM